MGEGWGHEDLISIPVCNVPFVVWNVNRIVLQNHVPVSSARVTECQSGIDFAPLSASEILNPAAFTAEKHHKKSPEGAFILRMINISQFFAVYNS